MDVHHRRASVEGRTRRLRHFCRRNRDRMLARIREHAGQAASDDRFLHGLALCRGAKQARSETEN